jgi:hypothetical protein
MKTMTDREVFDKVKKHLLTQRAKSEGDFGCLYRGPHGRKCAVGCLIPDEMYKRSLEGVTFGNDVVVQCLLKDTGVPESSFDMLRDLQQLHDMTGSIAESPAEWDAYLDDIAFAYFGEA